MTLIPIDQLPDGNRVYFNGKDITETCLMYRPRVNGTVLIQAIGVNRKRGWFFIKTTHHQIYKIPLKGKVEIRASDGTSAGITP